MRAGGPCGASTSPRPVLHPGLPRRSSARDPRTALSRFLSCAIPLVSCLFLSCFFTSGRADRPPQALRPHPSLPVGTGSLCMCPASGTLRKQGYRDTGSRVSGALLGPGPAGGWVCFSSPARGSGPVQHSVVDPWPRLAGTSPCLCPVGPEGGWERLRYGSARRRGWAWGRLGSGDTAGAPGRTAASGETGPTCAWTPDFQLQDVRAERPRCSVPAPLAE